MQELLAEADGSAIRRALEADGRYTLDVDGAAVVLEPDDVVIRAAAHEELVVVQDGAVAVALDTTLDDELRLEGIARELVRAINDHRKAIGFELADRIRVELRATGAVFNAVSRADIGFDSPDNEVVVLSENGERVVAKASKQVVAAAVLDEVERILSSA